MEIKSNLYFMCGLAVAGKTCLVVGNDYEAQDKALRLASYRARVDVIWSDFSDDFKKAVSGINNIQLHERAFNLDKDIHEQFLVVYCPQDDRSMTGQVAAKCRQKRVLICAIDQAEFCDVTNVSIVNHGLLRVGVSTGGSAPAVARKMREGLERDLAQTKIKEYLAYLASLRPQYEKKYPDRSLRRKKLIQATDGFDFKVQVTLPSDWEKNKKE